MSKTSTDAAGADQATEAYFVGGSTMGGAPYSARFHGPAGLDPEPLSRALNAAVDNVDRQMSGWKAGSDINRLNAAPTGEWVELPGELMTVLAGALEVEAASGGAFDIAVGEAVTAWGFGPPDRRPDADRIRALAGAPRKSASESLELDPTGGRARRLAPVGFDLGGIAKGFGADELARCLDRHGITDYLVGIDGELRARGGKPGGRPWVVGIEHPAGEGAPPLGTVALTDMAIATSGAAKNARRVGDIEVGHTINPATATPVQNRVLAVSVMADDGMRADAWATALTVLGEEAGANLAAQLGLNALLVLRGPEGVRVQPFGRFRDGRYAASGPGNR